MRVFGDLDGNESHGPSDLSGARTGGGNGHHKAENSGRASGAEGPISDKQAVEPRIRVGAGVLEPETDAGDAFAGGTPPADPPARPRPGGQYGKRGGGRIDGQILEPAGDLPTRERVHARRSNGGLWFVLMVLTLALIGAGAYLYLDLRNNTVTLSQVPELLQSIPTLGGRMDASEAKLRNLAANWSGLTNHLAELDRKVDSRLQATRNLTRVMVAQAEGRLQAELDQQGRAMNARLSNVESVQRQDHEQLAQLNDQLRGQVASLREQLNAAQENTGRDLANMQEQVSDNQGNLQTLARQLHRDRVTFELVKNSPTELAPGVTLTVLKTDVSYQRFRGYISLTNEGKTMWLKNLSAREAVDLYSQQFNHPYSLVVTAVNADGVAGYLLLPAGA